jgi:hypothetical protein
MRGKVIRLVCLTGDVLYEADGETMSAKEFIFEIRNDLIHILKV